MGVGHGSRQWRSVECTWANRSYNSLHDDCGERCWAQEFGGWDVVRTVRAVTTSCMYIASTYWHD